MTLVATLATAGVGHFQGQHLVDEQPMKMAAAEAQFDTREPAPFSLFATGDWTPNPGARTSTCRSRGCSRSSPKATSTRRSSASTSSTTGIERSTAPATTRVGLTYWSFLAHRLGAGHSSLREHLAALTGAGVVRQRRR